MENKIIYIATLSGATEEEQTKPLSQEKYDEWKKTYLREYEAQFYGIE